LVDDNRATNGLALRIDEDTGSVDGQRAAIGAEYNPREEAADGLSRQLHESTEQRIEKRLLVAVNALSRVDAPAHAHVRSRKVQPIGCPAQELRRLAGDDGVDSLECLTGRPLNEHGERSEAA
jgi:hypothetical protein